MSTWVSSDAFFEAFNVRTEREAYRLRALSRMMQDVPSRGERLTSTTSALGAFTLINADEVEHPSHGERRTTARENAYERESMRQAEKLRIGVKSAGAKTKHRAVRPVPEALVAWARALGVSIPSTP